MSQRIPEQGLHSRGVAEVTIFLHYVQFRDSQGGFGCQVLIFFLSEYACSPFVPEEHALSFPFKMELLSVSRLRISQMQIRLSRVRKTIERSLVC